MDPDVTAASTRTACSSSGGGGAGAAAEGAVATVCRVLSKGSRGTEKTDWIYISAQAAGVEAGPVRTDDSIIVYRS